MAVHLGFPCKVPKICVSDVPLGKIGDEPLWMAQRVEVVCCGMDSVFICQILAPGEEDRTYYRYIYVFQCVSCKLPQAVRCQLHKENPYIREIVEESKDPEDDWNTDTNSEQILKLLQAPSATEELQDLSLEILEEDHKQTQIINSLFSLNLKDEESVREFYENMEGGVESAGEEKINDSNDEEDDDIGVEDLEVEGKSRRDVAFDTMKWFISCNFKNPVVRYSKGGCLFWYSDSERPEIRPGKCGCGAVRVFECQVLPGIIGLVGNEGVEFGGIYVFTCPASCDQGYSVFEQAFYQPSL